MVAKTRKKSSLVSFEKLSPNRNKPRTGLICRLTPHHAAGNLTVAAILGLSKFQNYDPVGGGSCNYAIGSDGQAGLGVEETNRAWTSSSGANDHQTITFEIANSGGANDWRISTAAINTFLDMAVEIAQFYGFKKINYKEKPSNITIANAEAWIKTWAKDDEMIITLHNWFSATACPGPYFTRQIPWLVNEANKRLANSNYKPEAFVGEGEGPKVIETIKKTVDELAKEVIAGIWGNGQERIDKLTAAGYNALEVGDKVGQLLKTSTTAFQPYEVTISVTALNVRKGPGANEAVVATLVNDRNIYTIIEEKNGPVGDGTTGKWGKLKSGAGWVLLSYTKKR